jgi:hypothetical protein
MDEIQLAVGPTRRIARERATCEDGEPSKPTTTMGWGLSWAVMRASTIEFGSTRRRRRPLSIRASTW